MTRGVETVLGAIEGWTQPHGQACECGATSHTGLIAPGLTPRVARL